LFYPVVADILPSTKAAHPVAVDAIGANIAKIIFVVIVVLLLLAALVATGHITQKGPHGRGGPLGPSL
jgi:hypothetical protein